MSEAEYWTLHVGFVDAAAAVIGLGFTMFSVYVTGLYFYLARASLGVRVAGFAIFTVSCALMIALSLVMTEVALSALWCDACGPEGRGSPLRGLLLAGAPVGAVLALAIYAVLAAMTFSTKWRRNAFPRSVE